MASVLKHKDGWRAFIRRRGFAPQSRVFSTKLEAERWAREIEVQVDKGVNKPLPTLTMGELIEAYLQSCPQMGRSKHQALLAIQREIGSLELQSIGARDFIAYARERTAGPATIGMDLSYIRTVLTHTGVILGVTRECELARVQLAAARSTLLHLRTVRNKSGKRSRRPTQQELEKLRDVFDSELPLWTLTQFAIATCMRAGEITSLRWDDYNEANRSILIRSRKHPTEKLGNDQVIPLLSVENLDPVKLIEAQRAVHPELIFPYKSATISTLFPRFVQLAGIEDLRFHDLRHEGISRLFEAGYTIPEVAIVSGHRTWEQLKRYTNLNPLSLHRSP